jgi:hypothetical protein
MSITITGKTTIKEEFLQMSGPGAAPAGRPLPAHVSILLVES